MKKWQLILGIVVGMLVPMAKIAGANFQDVEGDAHQASIEYLEYKGVIQGYADGTFHPEQNITRAEWVKMLLSNYQFDPTRITRFTHPFSDVDNASWYAPYMERAWQMGLLRNRSTFGPGRSLSRVEAAEMMFELMGVALPRQIDESEWSLNYDDVQPENWFAPLVLYGTRNGVLDPADPEDTNSFGPFHRLTRGEATEWMLNADVFLYGQDIRYNDAEVVNTLFGAEEGSSTELTYDIPHLDIFLDVWNRIHEEYYGRDELDDETLMYGAIAGMVSALDDTYSTFFDPPEAEIFTNYLEGQLSGIGAQLVETEEGVAIANFLEGSPAENSGLHVNDRIVEVDGVDVRENSAEELVQLIRGEADTQVTLGVEREGTEEILYFTLTRAVLDVGYLSGEVMGDALYVDINLFDSLSFIDFTQTVQGLIEEKPDFKGFILDVRDNPGGYLDSVHSVIGHFVLRGNTVFYVNTSANHSYIYLSTGQSEWEDYPVVILMNENTASAAEILAIVLKEKQGAVLVGKHTYGKGTVQELVDYGDGSSLKLTVAMWRSSKYNNFDGIGIYPHYDVEYTLEDVQNGVDPQLEKALEVLEQKIEERAAEAAASESGEETK